MKYALTGLSLLLILITGCNDLDTPEVQGLNTNTMNPNTNGEREKNWNQSLFGPGPINYGDDYETETLDNISEQNTTGKSYRSPNAPHPTNADDQEKMENVIYDMPGVTPGMVILMGGHAWVNISFEEKVTGQVREDQIREVEERLYEVNPRYRYRVIVNDYQ